MKRSVSVVMFALLALSMILTACAPAATPTAQVVQNTVVVEKTVEVEKTVVVQATPEASKFKLAVVLPGVITDADYNTLGYLAGLAVQKDMGIPMAYSESVAVPDVERVMREYVDAGYNIIFSHGGQFITQTIALAKEFPNVVFICEADAKQDGLPANFWLIDRNFQTASYVMGYIAARTSQTGKIGYLAGLKMPFTYQEYHAVEQAIKDNNLNVEIKKIWTGDFNDPTKARQVADTMISENVDVIMGSLNLGMFGVFEAAKAAKGANPVLVTAKYTDKTSFAPKNYLTSSLYDFAGPLKNMVKKAQEGVMGGYYPFTYGDGFTIQTPVKNVSPEIAADVQKLVDDIKAGKITVAKDSTEVKE